MEWLAENRVLVLGIIGAAIALAVSLTSTVSKKPPVRVVALLTVLGSLVVVAQQLISASIEKQSEKDQQAADKARDQIIAAIHGTVDRTEDLVTNIHDRLGNADLSDLGERLVATQVRHSGAADVQTRDKASAEAWRGFADWVASNSGDPNTRLCMNLELGAGRSYRVDMILGYLLAGPGTADRIWHQVERGGWGAIAEDALVDEALLDWPGVDCVLFYDGASEGRELVAYATARDFALELLAQRRIGRKDAVEGLLNRPGPPSTDALTREFPSVRTSVLQSGEVETIVRMMIDRKWPQCVAVRSDGQYLVLLERVIRAAS